MVAQDTIQLKTTMTDVYDEDQEQESNFDVYVRTDNHGSLIIDDAPKVDFGSFNIILENRRGVAHLLIWIESDFANDPTWVIRMDNGARTN